MQVMIIKGQMSLNRAQTGGGLYATQQAIVTVRDSNFTANMADDLGAAVYSDAAAVLLFHDSGFSHNKAATGGTVHCSNCTVNSSGLTFEQNSGKAGGGLSVFGPATVSISNSTWHNNSASYGGAVLFTGSLTSIIEVTMSGCTFTHNHAEQNAGAISCSGCQGNLTASSFVANRCREGSGGGAAFSEGAKVVMISCEISGNKAADSGGGVFMKNGASVDIADSNFTDNTAGGYGGAIFVTDNSQLSSTSSIMRDNVAKVWGGALCLFSHAIVQMSLSNLLGNTAVSGGGLFAQDSAVVVLEHTLVMKNNASEDGGGMRTDGQANLSLLNGTMVSQNRAGASGGGVSLASSNFVVAQVVAAVADNSAKWGANVSVPATNITLLGKTSVPDFVNRVGTDDSMLHVIVYVTGYYGLPVQGYEIAADLIDGAVTASKLDLNISDAHGLVHMSLKVARPPGNYTVMFHRPDVPNIREANLTLHIRGCIRGEVAPIADTCRWCWPGSFSFEPTETTCRTCPANANCAGNDTIVPLPGYWRSSANSTQIQRCPNPSACNQHELHQDELAKQSLQQCAADPACGSSERYKDLQCSPGYYGNLCGMCSAGRGAVRLFTCRQCMKPGYIIALYVLAALVMLGLIRLLCYLTLNQSNDLAVAETDKPPAAQLLRPLVLYSQYMLIISSMPVEWPASIAYPLKVLAWVWSPASPETLSLECVLPTNSSLPMSIQKVLFYLCIPIMLLLVLVLTDMTVLHFKRAPARFTLGLRDPLVSSAMVAFFFFLPSIVRSLFTMFACVPIDHTSVAPYVPAAVGSFWVYDMNQQCFTGYHRTWSLALGLPIVVLVCLGAPLGILTLVTVNKDRLQDSAFQQHYGFLYMSYRGCFSWWECFVASQTILLVAISVFGVNLGIYYQAVVMDAALVIMVLMLMACKPYLYRQAGIVMVQALCCTLLSNHAALTFLPYGSVEPTAAYGDAMGSFLLVVNLAFVGSVLWKLAMAINWHMLLGKVRSLVRRLSECLMWQRKLHGVARWAGVQLAISSTSQPDPSNVRPITDIVI